MSGRKTLLFAGSILMLIGTAAPTAVGVEVPADLQARSQKAVQADIPAKRDRIDQADLLAQPATLESVDAPLGSALEAIARRAGFTLAYSADILPAERTVTPRAPALPTRDALARVLGGIELKPSVTPSGHVTIARRLDDPKTSTHLASSVPQQATVTATVINTGTEEAPRGIQSQALREPVTLALADVPLKAALEQIAREARLTLAYPPDLIPANARVSLQAKDSPVRDALERVLRGTGIEAHASAAHDVILARQSEPTDRIAGHAADGVAAGAISGRVTDAGTGAAIEGAGVLLEDARASTSTDAGGRYRLANVGTGSYTLVVARIGYESARRAVTVMGDVEVTVDIALRPSPTALREIVAAVTGTRIAGAEVPSPVVAISREQMRLSGQNDLGEVIRSLPQNFSGGQNPGVFLGAGGDGSNQNITGGSSLNLRGLGPDATLTLLNGARLPYDGFFQATDISVIPTAAIERMEVLLDGASAIYGSDAVGGVANIILRRDYQGAELSVRVGAATDGGYHQTQYTALAGDNWGSGGILITGDLSRNTPVRARQRTYLDYVPNQDDVIYPSASQKGAVISGHQSLSDLTELALDAFYTARKADRANNLGAFLNDTHWDAHIWGVAPSLSFDLGRDWSIRFHGFLGRNDADQRNTRFNNAGEQILHLSTCFCNQVSTAGLEAEGRLISLPGGEVRFSVGGGWRRNGFDRIDHVAGETNLTGAETGYYGYAEIDVPLVAENQGVPLVSRFILNGAMRHESYDSFGRTTTPKVGAIWGLTSGFDVKASWGRSFKVPTLFQQHAVQTLFLYPASLIGGSGIGASDDATVIYQSGGGADLDPERAEILTVGLVARPGFLPDFALEVGWFDIDYTGRVAHPISPLAEALFNPALADFVTLDPTEAQQSAAFAWVGLPVGTFTSNVAGPGFTPAPYDPAKVVAIVEDQYANAASQRMRGIDINARYTADLLRGTLALSSNGGWIIEAERNLTHLAPETPTAGITSYPAKFKGRLGASWSRNPFTVGTAVNHIGGVTDTNAKPNVQRDPMTTFDAVVGYQTSFDFVGDFDFNLAATNVFNERPPFAQPLRDYHVNYDPTNYSGLGRVVNLTITKRF